ncbi:MAG: crossover junction endodeoxyribonuclease RuvC [Candidatus Xenobiia bacterium LiM19]
MRILGIDPGTARTGYGVVDALDTGVQSVTYGCICTDKNTTKEKRLQILHEKVSELLSVHHPDVMAQELLFFSKNSKTAMVVGEARGVILLAAAQSNVPVCEYTPLQVKGSLSGYGRSSKDEIREMVKLHLGLSAIRSTDDAADALAIALCHLFYLETGAF